MTAVTVPDYLGIGNVMLMVTIATAWGAQRRKHLGPTRCQVILAMQLAEESIR